MNIGTALFCSAALSLACVVSCAAYRPPFTQAVKASPPADDQQATLVFLWPTTSCDPGGYVVLATEDGRFLGTVSSGTQLHTTIPPGPAAIVGWNEPQEKARGSLTKLAVSVLHGTVSPGHTYYVELEFGEWDDRGPREAYHMQIAQPGTRACISPDHVMSTALVNITPTSKAWKDLAQWGIELDGLVPDRVAGQAWLDARRGELQDHRTMAEERFAGLRPRARRMATLGAEDGVSSSPTAP
jgi:hypothetical protein